MDSARFGVMANQQIKRLWRRRPDVREAEFELLQARVRARLMGSAVHEPEAAAGPDELPDVVGVMAEPGDPVWDVSPELPALEGEPEGAVEPEATAELDAGA
jgi:hypothetical protein